MRIVTSGSAYIDIDAYAGCVGYAELLRAQGQEAKAVSTAPWNESITKSIRSLQAPLEKDYKPGVDSFVLIDVSDPEYFAPIINLIAKSPTTGMRPQYPGILPQ